MSNPNTPAIEALAEEIFIRTAAELNVDSRGLVAKEHIENCFHQAEEFYRHLDARKAKAS